MMKTIYSILVALLLMTANSYGQLLQDDGQKSKSEIIMWKKLLLFPHNVYTFEKLKLFLL